MVCIYKISGTILEPTIVVLVLVILLIVNAWIFKNIKSTRWRNGNLTKGFIAFFLVLMGVLAFILVLPIDKTLRGQILGFLGIIVSAGIALSSTTVLGNLIAGLMNNSMKRFRNGDLIKMGNFHGRVTQKSIFHTEIQLEDSNFMTIPNLYIANNPVKLTRKANTVIATSISLGYDIPREHIEKALKEAAIAAGLTDPYVYITALNDFSVVYKIHGFLADSSYFFSTHSLLNAKVMDQLHAQGIEIVSPTFMNQRRVEEKVFVPPQTVKRAKPEREEDPPEELVFDEAIKSEALETQKDYLKTLTQKEERLKEKLDKLKDPKEIAAIKSAIRRNSEMKERITQRIEEEELKQKKHKG